MRTVKVTRDMMKGDFMLRRGTTMSTRWRQRAGTLTGATYACSLESCRGKRVVVRWPGGQFTCPCGKGVHLFAAGSASTNFRHVWRIV